MSTCTVLRKVHTNSIGKPRVYNKVYTPENRIRKNSTEDNLIYWTDFPLIAFLNITKSSTIVFSWFLSLGGHISVEPRVVVSSHQGTCYLQRGQSILH